MSSAKDYPRSRRYTYIAGGLGLVAVAALGFVFFEIDQAEREYGAIKADITRFTREREEAVMRRDTLLKEISDSTRAQDDIEKEISALTGQRDGLASEVQKAEADLAKDREEIARLEQRKTEADAAIKAANDLRSSAGQLKVQNAELERAKNKLNVEIDGLKTDSRQAEQQKGQRLDDLAEAEKRLAAITQKISAALAEHANVESTQREIEALQGRRDDLNARITELTREIDDKQAVLLGLGNEITKAGQQVASARSGANEAQQQQLVVTSTKADLEKQVDALRSEVARLNGDKASAEASSQKAREEIATAEGWAKAAEERVTLAKTQLTQLQSQIDEGTRGKLTLDAQVDAARADLARLQAVAKQLGDVSTELASRMGEKKGLEADLNSLTERQSERSKEIESLEATLNTLKAELATLNGRKGALQQELSSLRAVKDGISDKTDRNGP